MLAALVALSAIATIAMRAIPPAPESKPIIASPVSASAAADIPLPQVAEEAPTSTLFGDDADLYASIFKLQDNGDFTAADAEIAKLEDTVLVGYVLQQRYLDPRYTATYEELARWMKAYADHPGAQKIYALAQKKKKTESNLALAAPRALGRGITGQYDFDVSHMSAAPNEEEKLTQTEKINARKDAQQAKQAEAYFYHGNVDTAYTLASTAAKRSGSHAPMAGWIAGLSAWKLGKYKEAAEYFTQTASSSRASAWMSAAGSYWAARSYMRAGQPQKVSQWLRKAAEYPRTFYGIIALKSLGISHTGFNWHVPSLTDKHKDALNTTPAGKRALALMEAERPDLAEAELRQINPQDNPLLQEAVITLASEGGMAELALRAGSTYMGDGGKMYDAALYPESLWQPDGGFSVDRALVYAFMRQESQFKVDAHNKSSGAKGLMQLMPSTAKHVAKEYGLSITTDDLANPEINIDLGQKYLKELLNHSSVDNNLFKLAVAYNAGPGKLSRWERSARYENDPLLFIESIPAAETRIFVERVMTNFWIYRIKFDQDTPSLDQVVQGEWPLYLAQDTHRGLRLALAQGSARSR